MADEICDNRLLDRSSLLSEGPRRANELEGVYLCTEAWQFSLHPTSTPAACMQRSILTASKAHETAVDLPSVLVLTLLYDASAWGKGVCVCVCVCVCARVRARASRTSRARRAQNRLMICRPLSGRLLRPRGAEVCRRCTAQPGRAGFQRRLSCTAGVCHKGSLPGHSCSARGA